MKVFALFSNAIQCARQRRLDTGASDTPLLYGLYTVDTEVCEKFC